MARIPVPEDIYEIIGKLMFAYGDEAEPIETLVFNLEFEFFTWKSFSVLRLFFRAEVVENFLENNF